MRNESRGKALLHVRQDGGREVDIRQAIGSGSERAASRSDEFVAALFPGEIQDIPSFVKYSGRLKQALSNHICDLLSRGISVVLDFPGNTRNQRQWFRDLFERANVEHELHYIDASDDLCKRQLRQRSAALPAGSAWTTDAEFDVITAYFQAPADDERFNVVRHEA